MESADGAYPRNLNRQIHGLRGFSALAVFVYHVYGMGMLWGFWPAALDPVAGFFDAGRHGVEIFFTISGFLITGSLIRHRSVRGFLIDRCIRIYPVFMTIQLLVFTLGPIIHYKWLAGIGAAAWAGAFVENALFLPGIFDLPLAQLNAWSLSFEAGFYLLAAGLFTLAAKAGRWTAAILLGVLLIPILAIFPKCIFFVVGAAIFFITTRRLAAVPRLFRILSLPALILTLALLTLGETGSVLILAAAIPAFIFFWSVVDGRCLLSLILKTPTLQYLGTISYSFYLWSPVVTFPMKFLIQRVVHGRLPDLAIVALFAVFGFALSVVVADASYRLLEARASRWLHGWARTRRHAVQSSVSR